MRFSNLVIAVGLCIMIVGGILAGAGGIAMSLLPESPYLMGIAFIGACTLATGIVVFLIGTDLQRKHR